MNTLKSEFPKEGQYVLGKLKDKPWLDSKDKEGNRLFVVVKWKNQLPFTTKSIAI